MRAVITLAVFIAMSSSLYADEVKLKTGRTMQGEIIEKTDKQIKLQSEDGLITVIGFKFIDEKNVAELQKIKNFSNVPKPAEADPETAADEQPAAAKVPDAQDADAPGAKPAAGQENAGRLTAFGNKPDDKPYTGELKDYYESGNISTISHYKNDELDGITQQFGQDGTLLYELTFKDGKLLNDKGEPYEGAYEAKAPDGSVVLKAELKAGRFEGKYQSYLPGGVIKKEYTFLNGKLEGPFKEYHENGKLMAEGTLSDQLPEGEMTSYYEDGKIESRMSFRAGLPEGKVETYYSNGKIASETMMTAGGEPTTIVAFNSEGGKFMEVSMAGGVPSAKYYDEEGNLLKEVDEYTQALKEKPSDSALHYGRGLRCMIEGRAKEAILDFGYVLDADPKNVRALSKQSNLFFMQKNYDQALEGYLKVKEVDPAYHDLDTILADIYYYRGWENLQQKKYDAAIADNTQIINNYPKYYNLFRTYNNRGIAYADKGDHPAAIADYEKTISINHYYKAYYNRAYAKKEKNDFDGAIADYKKAIAIQPDYVAAYHNLGNIYLLQEKYDEAIAEYNKLLEVDRTFPGAYRGLSDAYAKKGDMAKSREFANRALNMEPKEGTNYFNMGNNYLDSGDYVQAVGWFTKALELNPQDADALNNRGKAFFKQNNFDLALSDFTAAIAIKPDLGAAYANRGQAYLYQQKMDLATPDLMKGIELAPDSPEALNGAGIMYMLQGKNAEAIAAYTKVLTANPYDGESYNNRAAVYFNTGEMDKCVSDLKSAKSLGVAIPQGFADLLQSRGIDVNNL